MTEFKLLEHGFVGYETMHSSYEPLDTSCTYIGRILCANITPSGRYLDAIWGLIDSKNNRYAIHIKYKINSPEYRKFIASIYCTANTIIEVNLDDFNCFRGICMLKKVRGKYRVRIIHACKKIINRLDPWID